MNVSCVIPTKNRKHKLKKAIYSVINGTCSVDEIIIVDDGGDDGSDKICTIIAKDIQNTSKTKIIYKKIPPSGVSKARNVGIRLACSEWVCFLDSDDIWHANKLQEHKNFHKSNDCLISQTREIWIKNSQKILPDGKLKKQGGMIFNHCIQTCCISASCVMIHKSIFDDIGYFDESFIVCEDYDLWLRIAIKYKIGLIDKYEVSRYEGDDQLSKKYKCMDEFRVQALLKHIHNTKSDFYENIKNELIKKCNILIKGALKHNNKQIYQKYSHILQEISKY